MNAEKEHCIEVFMILQTLQNSEAFFILQSIEKFGK